MSRVRFAMLCDTCQKRSPEYGHWYICRLCLADTCPDCLADFARDDEMGEGYCKGCMLELPRYEPSPVASRSITAALAGLCLVLVGWVAWAIANHVTPWKH